jgi:hypothetical protein
MTETVIMVRKIDYQILNCCYVYSHGFNDIWDFPDSVNSKKFVSISKQRVIDCFCWYFFLTKLV